MNDKYTILFYYKTNKKQKTFRSFLVSFENEYLNCWLSAV